MVVCVGAEDDESCITGHLRALGWYVTPAIPQQENPVTDAFLVARRSEDQPRLHEFEDMLQVVIARCMYEYHGDCVMVMAMVMSRTVPHCSRFFQINHILSHNVLCILSYNVAYCPTLSYIARNHVTVSMYLCLSTSRSSST